MVQLDSGGGGGGEDDFEDAEQRERERRMGQTSSLNADAVEDAVAASFEQNEASTSQNAPTGPDLESGGETVSQQEARERAGGQQEGPQPSDATPPPSQPPASAPRTTARPDQGQPDTDTTPGAPGPDQPADDPSQPATEIVTLPGGEEVVRSTETGRILGTPEAVAAQREQQRDAAAEQLEAQIEEQLGRDVEPGVDFEVVRTGEGFTARLTGAFAGELSREAAREAGFDLGARADAAVARAMLEGEGPALEGSGLDIGTGVIKEFEERIFRQRQQGTGALDVGVVETIGERRAAQPGESEQREALERQLEQQTGAELDPGEDFTIEKEDGQLTAELTASGRIKAAGVVEGGQTFLDQRIEAFEEGTGIDVIPGEFDVIQAVEAELERAAQVQREGQGLLPSPGEAASAADRVSEIFNAGGIETAAQRGLARRFAEIANPAEVTLGFGRAGEAIGEFGFNTALSALPVEDIEGRPPRLGGRPAPGPAIDPDDLVLEGTGGPGPGIQITTGTPFGRTADADAAAMLTDIKADAARKRDEQIAEAAALVAGLGAVTATSFAKRPAQTAGSALAEGATLGLSTALSPVRVGRATVPLGETGATTIRALRVEAPAVASPFTRRTGRTVASAKGFRPTLGTATVDLEDVDFERLGSRAGGSFEPVGIVETEVFSKSARRAGGAIAERRGAVEGAIDIGDAPRRTRGLELTETEDILAEARAVPEAKAGQLARTIEEFDDAVIKGSAATRAQLPDARQPRDVDLLVPDVAEARGRLAQVLEDANADVEDIFDLAPLEEFPTSPAQISKSGRFGRRPLRTEGGVGVNPVEAEFLQKAGAAGFFRGPGVAGTADIDIGPEPRRPGRLDVREKDVFDVSAVGRELLQREFIETPIIRPLKRRRIRSRAGALEEFERAFADDFDLPGRPVLPERDRLFRKPDFDFDIDLGEADRGTVHMGDILAPFEPRAARRGDVDRGRRPLNRGIDDIESPAVSRGPSGAPSPAPSPGGTLAPVGVESPIISADIDSPSARSPGAAGRSPGIEAPALGTNSPAMDLDDPGLGTPSPMLDSPDTDIGTPSRGPGRDDGSPGVFDTPDLVDPFPSPDTPPTGGGTGVPGRPSGFRSPAGARAATSSLPLSHGENLDKKSLDMNLPDIEGPAITKLFQFAVPTPRAFDREFEKVFDPSKSPQFTRAELGLAPERDIEAPFVVKEGTRPRRFKSAAVALEAARPFGTVERTGITTLGRASMDFPNVEAPAVEAGGRKSSRRGGGVDFPDIEAPALDTDLDIDLDL